MLSDSLERSSGSYNYQRFNFSNLSSFKFDLYLHLFIRHVCCLVGLLSSPSLVPEPPRGQLLAEGIGSDPQCYEHATCFARS